MNSQSTADAAQSCRAICALARLPSGLASRSTCWAGVWQGFVTPALLAPRCCAGNENSWAIQGTAVSAPLCWDAGTDVRWITPVFHCLHRRLCCWTHVWQSWGGVLSGMHCSWHPAVQARMQNRSSAQLSLQPCPEWVLCPGRLWVTACTAGCDARLVSGKAVSHIHNVLHPAVQAVLLKLSITQQSLHKEAGAFVCWTAPGSFPGHQGKQGHLLG